MITQPSGTSAEAQGIFKMEYYMQAQAHFFIHNNLFCKNRHVNIEIVLTTSYGKFSPRIMS